MTRTCAICAKDFQKTFAEMFDSVMQMEFSE